MIWGARDVEADGVFEIKVMMVWRRLWCGEVFGVKIDRWKVVVWMGSCGASRIPSLGGHSEILGHVDYFSSFMMVYQFFSLL